MQPTDNMKLQSIQQKGFPAVKSRLEKYVKVGKLGEGTYGVVYKAQGEDKKRCLTPFRQENQKDVRAQKNPAGTGK